MSSWVTAYRNWLKRTIKKRKGSCMKLQLQQANQFFVSLPPEPVGNSAVLAIGARGNTWGPSLLLCGKPQHVACFAKLLPKPVRSRDKTLALFFSLLLLKKCCPALIKPPILQHLSHHHCLQDAVASRFVSTNLTVAPASFTSKEATWSGQMLTRWKKFRWYVFKMALWD